MFSVFLKEENNHHKPPVEDVDSNLLNENREQIIQPDVEESKPEVSNLVMLKSSVNYFCFHLKEFQINTNNHKLFCTKFFNC